jgi:hypothetical protein
VSDYRSCDGPNKPNKEVRVPKSLTFFLTVVCVNTTIAGESEIADGLMKHGALVVVDSSNHHVIRVLFMFGPASDSDIGSLCELKQLHTLDLSNSQLTNVGIRDLGRLRGLKVLILNGARATDAHIHELSGMTNIESLSLFACPITDGAVKDLAMLKSLRFLDVRATNITPQGILDLRTALPNCRLLVLHIK